jgi:hypothetical protein
MSKIRTQACARVRVTIVIPIGGGAWGDDCTVGQIHKQAIEGAKVCLRQGFVVEGLVNNGAAGSIKAVATIVGEPIVEAIIVEDA